MSKINSNTLQNYWHDYEQSVLDRTIHSLNNSKIVKYSFYAGALAALSVWEDTIAPDVPPEQGAQMMKALLDELDVLTKALEKGEL